MKKLLIFALIVAIASCNRQKEDRSLKPNDLLLSYGIKFDKLLLGVESYNDQVKLTNELKVDSQGITLPIGTIIEKVKGDPTTFTYKLPDGYKLIGQNADGKARTAAAGSITCTCKIGRGCNPFIATLGKNQVMGCSMTGNCTQCTQTTGAKIGATDEVISNLEIINFNQELHFITTKQELSSTVSPSKTLMDIDEVRQQIVFFAKAFQLRDLYALNKTTGPDNLPATYTYLHVNVYGRVVLIPVQTDLVHAANPLLNELLRDIPRDNSGRMAATTTVYKCTCLSGGAGCIFNTGGYLIAKAIWCDSGGCASCRLGWL